MLHDYAERLNVMPFVRNSGAPYFVSKRGNPGSKTGEIEHFLDRGNA